MKKIFNLSLAIFLATNIFAQFGYPTRISNDTEICNNPKKIIAADMDNDGDMDLVVSQNYPLDLVWFENLDGQGAYGDAVIVGISPGNSLTDIEVVDINNDGNLDIVVMQGQEVYWYKNQLEAKVIFSDKIYLPGLPGYGDQLIIGDVNGNGYPDVLVIGAGPADKNHIGWYESKAGTDDFEDYLLISELAKTFAALKDIDNDGDLDILTTIFVPISSFDSFRLIENLDGAGNFGTETILKDTIPIPSEFLLEDLDNDGDLDLIVHDRDDHVYLYKNLDGLGHMGNSQFLSGDFQYGTAPPIVLDFDDDGDLDIQLTTSKYSRMYENSDGQGDFTTSHELHPPYRTPIDMISTDVNNDGLEDVVMVCDRYQTHQAGFVYKNKTNGLFSPPSDFLGDAGRISLNSNNGLISSVDLDGDGIKELIAGSSSYGKIAWQKFENTPLKFDNPTLLPFQMDLAFGVDFGDMDGDGDLDIVANFAPYVDFGNDRVSWFERDSSGQIDFSNRHDLHVAGYVGGDQVSAIDVDDDGDLDVLANFDYFAGGIDETGVFYVENIDGLGTFAPSVRVSNRSSHAIFKDVDADGDVDILHLNTDLSNYSIGWTINNNGTFATPTELITNLPQLSRFFYEDIDNDGLEDIIYTFESTLFWHKNEGVSFGVAQIYYEDLGDEIKDLFFTKNKINNQKDFYLLKDSEILFFENTGILNELALPNWVSNSDGSLTHIYLDDFDGDKDLDLITYSRSEETMFFQENYTNLPSIIGKVYLDENENGNFDIGEIPLYLQTIKIFPGSLQALTTPYGEIKFSVKDGNYFVSCNPTQNFNLTTPQSYNIEILDCSDTTVFFGLIPSSLILDANIEIVSGPIQCDSEVPFWIDYQNTGTMINDAVIYVKMDTSVSFVSSSPSPDSIVGEYVYWSHENLPPTYSGQIQMILQMPNLDLDGEWINNEYFTQMTSDDGSASILKTNNLRTKVNCQLNLNQKLVEPSFPNHDNYTYFGDTLKYIVRFQNKGVDTVSTVRIEDYLDSNLDWSTLKILGTSHPYEVTLDQTTGRMLFTFENILLPDNTTNLIESNGFIHYQINHKSGLPEHTVIQNTAGIYFDFNPPIFTNTVENILVSQYPISIDIKQPSCTDSNDGRLNVIFDLPISETYLWNTGDTTAILDSLSSGSYQLLFTTSDGTQIDTTITLINPSPFDISNVTTNDVSCFGLQDGSINIQPNGGVPGYNYEWNNGDLSAQIDTLSAGQYTVTVIDANGCLKQDSFFISEPEAIEISANTTMTTCFGGSDGMITPTIQGGIPGYTYIWNTGSNQPSLTQIPAGSYTLTVSDTNGCSEEKIIEIGSPPPITLTTLTTSETEQNMDGTASVEATGGVPPYTFTWGHDSTLTDSIITNLNAGDYNVTVTDVNNCTQTEFFSIDQMTTIKELENEVYFNVSPNPTFGDLNIEIKFSSRQEWQILIYDVIGQPVRIINAPTNGNLNEKISLQLPSGVYTVSLLVRDKHLQTKTIVVQK